MIEIIEAIGKVIEGGLGFKISFLKDLPTKNPAKMEKPMKDFYRL